MAINPLQLLKMKGMWEQFLQRHPKCLSFLKAIGQEGVVNEGSVIEINVVNPDGKKLSYNLKITADDMELFEVFKSGNN